MLKLSGDCYCVTDFQETKYQMSLEVLDDTRRLYRKIRLNHVCGLVLYFSSGLPHSPKEMKEMDLPRKKKKHRD